jgi:DNA-binding transcriptional ArsR family regulator
MKKTLKARLEEYFRRNHSMFIASGDLQRLVMQKTNYTPQNVGRRLRELAEEGVLEVEYRKGHAYYRLTVRVQQLTN